MGGDDVATRGTPGALGRWARVTGSSPENPKAARPRGALDAGLPASRRCVSVTYNHPVLSQQSRETNTATILPRGIKGEVTADVVGRTSGRTRKWPG